MQTYNFKEFMKGTHEQPKNEVRVYSSVLPIAIPYALKAMFFHSGVVIVGGVGLVAIGLTIWENYLAKKGNEVGADLVATFGGILLPLGVVVMAFITVFRLGGMFL